MCDPGVNKESQPGTVIADAWLAKLLYPKGFPWHNWYRPHQLSLGKPSV
jgi:hypothetical protein